MSKGGGAREDRMGDGKGRSDTHSDVHVLRLDVMEKKMMTVFDCLLFAMSFRCWHSIFRGKMNKSAFENRYRKENILKKRTCVFMRFYLSISPF